MSDANRTAAEADSKQVDSWLITRWVIAATVFGMVLGFAACALLSERAWLAEAQALVLVLLSVGGIGGFVAILMSRQTPNGDAQNAWLPVAIFATATMATAAARTGQLSFVQAVLVVMLGSVALVAAANALSLFRQGEAIEFETSWGGLGSALGGWRLSSATSLIVSAFLFACCAIVSVQISRPQGTTTETKVASGSDTATKPTTTNAVAAQPAPATAPQSTATPKP
ncbi:hypothetical protein ACQR1Y_09180 [Bradyrhizobium sp. HKCCYLRH3099]|uniref:hypothetical protein n=1 Tax=unclassified Bradyrhizobium TaxID=2631580 RepID=UPI003EBA892E